MADLGGLGVSQIAVLAPGFSSEKWLAQFGAIPATRSFEKWGEGKGALIASWHSFKGLEADGIVTFETPISEDAGGRMDRYLAWLRTKHLFGADLRCAIASPDDIPIAGRAVFR